MHFMYFVSVYECGFRLPNQIPIIYIYKKKQNTISTVCTCLFVHPKLVHWGVKQQKFDHIFKRGVIQPIANSIYSACMYTQKFLLLYMVHYDFSLSYSFSIRYESHKHVNMVI